MIGIGFTDLTGYGLQQMTIAGLVIALGLLVDNAIVVIENISRFIKMGYDAKEAAVRGTNQIAWAVVSSTATTVLAFVPMMLMKNITGDFIRSMPLTVVYTLTASLFISLTLTPYLSSKFIRIKTTTKNPIRNFLDHFIETKYRSSLDFALIHPKLVVAIALVVFTASLSLFPLIGVSFFPKAEKPQFVININTPKGTNLDKTDKVVRYVESVLAKQDEIKNFAANIGHGNPRIYYNVIPAKTRSTNAQIFVELKTNSKLNAAFIDNLRKTFADYAGAKIKVKEFEQGPPVDAPIVIRVLGENLDVLKRIARDVEEIVNSAQGTVNVINPLRTAKADLRLKIDRDKAGMLGVPLAEIDRTVRTALAGWPISKYRDAEGKEYNIVVRLPIRDKPHLTDLDKIYVSSLTGAQIPLNQLASLEFKSTPLIIEHFNMERYVMITADVHGKTSVDIVMQKIIKKLDRYQWPKGYRYAVGGELEAREESFGGMAKAIIIAVIGIFAVLVLQFRSYSQPFIVFSAIPLALIGSLLALFITGYHFSFTAFVGLTSLVGIVVNNSIILVDYTNQLRSDGKPLIPALKEAGEARFVPIILTTLTTVGGLLPLTLIGGTLFAPMGWTIIGGLLASTFLTLIIVPVLYKLFTRPLHVNVTETNK
ncbi:MAG: efflux RND transporter permease subunit [Calditrichaeota bacterium]|nr:efflux RND transporter permease subunit [Calditrichota bacterium]